MIKKLPLYVSNFKEMIEDNYVYVDKTEHIYNLMKDKAYYFLSRPRRFGKTLLVSTLKELFLGNKKLFENLWISSSDFDWQEHPVIHLDFSIIDHSTAEELKISLARKLQKIAEEYGIDISRDPSLGSMLETLVVEMSKKNKVVILVDEYDKPILDHLKNIDEAEEQREVLKSFYSAVKGLDPYYRAIFVTGVSRFSKTSLFSGFNNLNDISIDPKAAQLLGYTQKELESYFFTEIKEFAELRNEGKEVLIQRLKKWYNGYRFSELDIKVYNPFSIIYVLDKTKLLNYWFESGTPSFLIHLFLKQYNSIEMIDQAEIDQGSLTNFDVNNIPLIPLLFQTGYLTISDYDGKTEKYKLNFPNYEVELSFTKFFVASLAQTSRIVLDTFAKQLIEALNNNDIEKFCSVLETLFAHIPYMIAREDYYHILFQFLLSLLSLEAQSEMVTNKGRIDLTLTTQTHFYIFELKFNASPEIALDQIKKRGYYERFMNKGKPIVLIGLAFSHDKDQLKLNCIKEIIS